MSGEWTCQEHVGKEKRTRESHSCGQTESKGILIRVHGGDNTRSPEWTLVVDAEEAAQQKDNSTYKGDNRGLSVLRHVAVERAKLSDPVHGRREWQKERWLGSP